jgi:glycosyltransferase involved in cell wall biosynthesis
MKILFVSQYFPPEMGAPAARVYELAHRWVERGHEVAVLTGFPNHPTGIVPPEYRAKRRRLFCHEQIRGIQVVRVWLLPFPNRQRYERILNYTSYWLSSSLAGMFLPRPDVVVATSPQLLVGMTGWWLAKVHRVPFVFEVRDLWPESLAAAGVARQDSQLYRILGWIARFLYRRCDQLVVVTSAFKTHLVANWNVAEKQISVVENGVETDFFTPEGSDGFRRAFGLEGKFVVSYIGTLGAAHGLETMLEAAAHFQKGTPELIFLLVGEGAEKENLRSLAAKRGLTNLVFVGQQSRELVPSVIRASDACLALLRKREIFKTVVPTKLLEFMSCGRPVIVGVDGEARKIIEGAQAGLYVEPENVDALAHAIRKLYHNSSLRQRLGDNGRRWIVEHLTRRATAEKYL